MQLRAGDRSISAIACAAKGRSCSSSPAASVPRPSPSCRRSSDRLTDAGFDTGGADGRVGRDTMAAVRDFQRKVGLEPADGYAGLKVLARLRAGQALAGASPGRAPARSRGSSTLYGA